MSFAERAFHNARRDFHSRGSKKGDHRRPQSARARSRIDAARTHAARKLRRQFRDTLEDAEANVDAWSQACLCIQSVLRSVHATRMVAMARQHQEGAMAVSVDPMRRLKFKRPHSSEASATAASPAKAKSGLTSRSAAAPSSTLQHGARYQASPSAPAKPPSGILRRPSHRERQDAVSSPQFPACAAVPGSALNNLASNQTRSSRRASSARDSTHTVSASCFRKLQGVARERKLLSDGA